MHVKAAVAPTELMKIRGKLGGTANPFLAIVWDLPAEVMFFVLDPTTSP